MFSMEDETSKTYQDLRQSRRYNDDMAIQPQVSFISDRKFPDLVEWIGHHELLYIDGLSLLGQTYDDIEQDLAVGPINVIVMI